MMNYDFSSVDIDDEYEKFIIKMNPPRVIVDNDTCSNSTLVKVDSANKYGSLLEVVQVLSDLNFTIERAYISSDGSRFMDVFHVVDQNGNKLYDEEVTERIQQENYESLLKKNSKQEEEIAGLVSSLKEVKEEMRSLKQEIENKTTNSPEMNINETTIITPVMNGIKTSISPHINEAAKNKKKGLMNQISGLKIYCKPQGTILWPELKSTSTIDHGTSVDTTTANEALTAPAEKSSEFNVMFEGSGIPTPPSCSSITSPPKLIGMPSNTASVILPLQFNDQSNVYLSVVSGDVNVVS